MKQVDPVREVDANNQWYVGDQFKEQLGSRSRRRIVEDRWATFDSMIRNWIRLHSPRSIRILDAGCGDGINIVGLKDSAALSELEYEIHGVDYNPLRLERARKTGAVLVRGSVDALPYAEACFDVIICNQVLEHVPNFMDSLLDFRRVLSAGGLLILGVPNEGCALAQLRNHVIQPTIARKTDHVNFFTEGAISKHLQGAGLHILDVQRETFFFPCSYANMGLSTVPGGFGVMSVLRRLFPSQAGGLLIACAK